MGKPERKPNNTMKPILGTLTLLAIGRGASGDLLRSSASVKVFTVIEHRMLKRHA